MSTESFYDSIAPFYDLIYPDWDKSISRQAAQLSSIIDQFSIARGSTLLDVSCGIGTQALGLAGLGYRVTASDLSSGEVERARREAEKRNISLELSVCDMKKVADHYQKTFDIVLSADNSVPHLLSDREILEAFKQFYQCTRPGGICIVTVRDYENEKLESGVIRPYGIQEREDGRYLMFQVWDVDGDHYTTSMYSLRDLKDGTCDSQVSRAKYYAVPVSRLASLLKEAGFYEVQRMDGVFFQPVIVAQREE